MSPRSATVLGVNGVTVESAMSIFEWFKERREAKEQESRQAALAALLEADCARVEAFVSDEEAQNRKCPQNTLAMMRAGGGVDRDPNGVGEFGRDIRNAIPVNGPYGEILYLSSLVTSAGTHIIAHRLGSVPHPATPEKYVDAYEAVTLDGSRWDILFFDMYHTRKSQLVPSGYRREGLVFLYATNSFVPDFPASISSALIDVCKKCAELPPRDKKVWDAAGHSRAREHALRLNSLVSAYPSDLPQSLLSR